MAVLTLIFQVPKQPQRGGAARPWPQSCPLPLPEQEVPTLSPLPSQLGPLSSRAPACRPLPQLPLVAMVLEEAVQRIPEKHPKIHTSSPLLPHSLSPTSKPPFVQLRPGPLPPKAAKLQRRSRSQRVQEMSQGTPAQPSQLPAPGLRFLQVSPPSSHNEELWAVPRPGGFFHASVTSHMQFPPPECPSSSFRSQLRL